ncbi:hypothetical protein, partial [Cryobacterium sp. MLB-32]|uniref:hypothetical protein n=1 Tax=Cryobacterium sp. MLB-32 TaxID=1529318 RepID=UPI001E5965AB
HVVGDLAKAALAEAENLHAQRVGEGAVGVEAGGRERVFGLFVVGVEEGRIDSGGGRTRVMPAR